MKIILSVLCCVCLCIAGCESKDHAAIKIGSVRVSPQEFEEAFRESRYARVNDAGREMFLEQFIDTKLILLEAERTGLDKDPDFLKDIQRFWEQALLKRVVAEKNKEFAAYIKVTPEEALAYYQQHKQDDFQGKSFDEVQDQVKWVVLKIKQSQAFSSWTDQLEQRADIQVNKARLGIKP